MYIWSMPESISTLCLHTKYFISVTFIMHIFVCANDEYFFCHKTLPICGKCIFFHHLLCWWWVFFFLHQTLPYCATKEYYFHIKSYFLWRQWMFFLHQTLYLCANNEYFFHYQIIPFCANSIYFIYKHNWWGMFLCYSK